MGKQRITAGLLILALFCACTSEEVVAQVPKREKVSIDKGIFQVEYSETKEQPLKLTYKSSNRPKGADRGTMDFYTEKDVHTSDSKDYYRNIYDKGHLAPAATFSDNMVNLKQTFSYLNCALQDQYLNRGEWRLLEEQERKWDDEQELVVTVDLEFDGQKVPTDAWIPVSFTKHIKFTKSNEYKCYFFLNVKPTKGWEEHEVKHKHD